MMKAFVVSYETPGTSGYSEIVLVEKEEEIEQALDEKVAGYKKGTPYSKIIDKKEVPLSTVKLAELSVTEFLKLQRMI